MKYKMFVGLLVASLVLTSATTVRAQTLAVPSWVPAKIDNFTMVYNGSLVSGLQLGTTDIVKSNWTQLYIKNDSTSLLGVVGVLTMEYTQDFFSKPVPALIKYGLSMGAFSGLPTFTGTSTWDLFFWMMGLISTGNNETAVVDEKASVPNAMGAFSFNVSCSSEWNFYMLYAYKAQFAMMVFAMDFHWNLTDMMMHYEAADGQIKSWFESYVGLLVAAFGSIMTVFATLASGLGMASLPEIAGGSITPTGTTDVPTSEQDVNTLGNSYAGSLPGGIPGYPVALIGIASLFAVLFIVQKKRKAIVA